MNALRWLIIASIALLSSLQCMALKPSKVYKHVPSDFNMPYEVDTIRTADGATLISWRFNNENLTQRTLLVCHNGDGNMADQLERVDEFMNLGFNVVLFDYRGFGHSSAFKIDTNMYIYPEFIKDMDAMIDYCDARSVYPITVYGWGMSGGMVLGRCYTDSRVSNIISDSPFLALKGTNRKPVADTSKGVATEDYPQKYEPFYAMHQQPGARMRGVLLIGGKQYEQANAEFALLRSNHQSLVQVDIMPDASAGNGFEINPSYYLERMNKFLNEDADYTSF